MQTFRKWVHKLGAQIYCFKALGGINSLKMEIQRNKDVKIPVGFRFYPTDEELIIHYLKRKVYSLQLPATVIPELDVFQTNPSDLPG